MNTTNAARAPKQTNPKLLHRVYFENMAPFYDPFKHYLETWAREMPDYQVMKWNASNVDVKANEWVERANKAKAPVFISEYARWKALSDHGGMYIDADCEILNGKRLDGLIEELYASDEYDAFIGVEEAANGHPTAQTVAAKKGSGLVAFMMDMYERQLAGPLWHWREERGLIGPQLMSLYFRDLGFNLNKGFFCHLDAPMVFGRVKVYTQDYFSPKFTSTGQKLNVTKNTCIYHLFSNLNIEQVDPEAQKHREKPLLFNEYCEYLEKNNRFSGNESQLSEMIARHDALHSQKIVLEEEVALLRENIALLKDKFRNARLENRLPGEAMVSSLPAPQDRNILEFGIPIKNARGKVSVTRLLWLMLTKPRYMLLRLRNKLNHKAWNYQP